MEHLYVYVTSPSFNNSFFGKFLILYKKEGEAKEFRGKIMTSDNLTNNFGATIIAGFRCKTK